MHYDFLLPLSFLHHTHFVHNLRHIGAAFLKTLSNFVWFSSLILNWSENDLSFHCSVCYTMVYICFWMCEDMCQNRMPPTSIFKSLVLVCDSGPKDIQVMIIQHMDRQHLFTLLKAKSGSISTTFALKTLPEACLKVVSHHLLAPH